MGLAKKLRWQKMFLNKFVGYVKKFDWNGNKLFPSIKIAKRHWGMDLKHKKSKILLYIEINEIISSVIPIITAKQWQFDWEFD